eukprot:8551277-Prorocentrum_lima.AAC.1
MRPVTPEGPYQGILTWALFSLRGHIKEYLYDPDVHEGAISRNVDMRPVSPEGPYQGILI